MVRRKIVAILATVVMLLAGLIVSAPAANAWPGKCSTTGSGGLSPDGMVTCAEGSGSYRVVVECKGLHRPAHYYVAGRKWVNKKTLSFRTCGHGAYSGKVTYYARSAQGGNLGSGDRVCWGDFGGLPAFYGSSWKKAIC